MLTSEQPTLYGVHPGKRSALDIDCPVEMTSAVPDVVVVEVHVQREWRRRVTDRTGAAVRLALTRLTVSELGCISPCEPSTAKAVKQCGEGCTPKRLVSVTCVFPALTGVARGAEVTTEPPASVHLAESRDRDNVARSYNGVCIHTPGNTPHVVVPYLVAKLLCRNLAARVGLVIKRSDNSLGDGAVEQVAQGVGNDGPPGYPACSQPW